VKAKNKYEEMRKRYMTMHPSEPDDIEEMVKDAKLLMMCMKVFLDYKPIATRMLVISYLMATFADEASERSEDPEQTFEHFMDVLITTGKEILADQDDAVKL
jgi:hypothetical protein